MSPFGKHLFIETRARVYLLWAVLVTAGFIATDYHQRKTINPVWFTLSLIGLGYMYRVMPLKVRQMRNIFLAWLVPITVGIAISGIVFYIKVEWAYRLIAHLGAFWLLVMAIGYLWNGLVDRPMGWYIFAVVINVGAAILCLLNRDWTQAQYLVAAIVSAWSMLNLWLFRT